MNGNGRGYVGPYVLELDVARSPSAQTNEPGMTFSPEAIDNAARELHLFLAGALLLSWEELGSAPGRMHVHISVTAEPLSSVN